MINDKTEKIVLPNYLFMSEPQRSFKRRGVDYPPEPEFSPGDRKLCLLHFFTRTDSRRDLIMCLHKYNQPTGVWIRSR